MRIANGGPDEQADHSYRADEERVTKSGAANRIVTFAPVAAVTVLAPIAVVTSSRAIGPIVVVRTRFGVCSVRRAVQQQKFLVCDRGDKRPGPLPGTGRPCSSYTKPGNAKRSSDGPTSIPRIMAGRTLIVVKN